MIGLFQAENGENVLTAPRERMVFHSEYSCPKILKKGEETVPHMRGGDTFMEIVEHNIGYIPMVLYYYEDAGTLRMSNILSPNIVLFTTEKDMKILNFNEDTDLKTYYYIMANEL